MSKKLTELVADFETTTDREDCRVWAYGLSTVELEPSTVYGNCIEDFIDRIEHESTIIWFHNLAFDGSFIIDWLLNNHYTWVKDSPGIGEFTTLISGMGKFYQIVVRWFTGQRTYFKDSLKKLPMSVSQVAKTFKFEEGKGELDYTKHRPIGYEPTTEEWDYIRRDVEIVARALYRQGQQGMKKLTVGSDALAEYKQITGKQFFEKWFPILDEEMDTTVRTAYRGGFTYADPRHTGKRTRSGQTFDVNSLYPYVMRKKELPYGLPTWFEGAPPTDGSQYVVSITFTGAVKKGHIPCVQAKKSMFYRPTDYLTEVDEPLTLVVTNIDLELIQDHYNIDIHCYNGGMVFRSTTGLFNEYIDKWSKVKENSEGGTKAIAKLFLNSLYGKFATNPDITGKYPVLEDGVVKLKKGEEETRDPVYTPVGVFITSWARDITIRAAQANYDTFAYADTDSLHLLTDGEPKGIEVDPSKLGVWKREYGFKEAVFLRAKQYGELKDDGGHEIHIAGAPHNIVETLTLDDLKSGNVFYGKLVPERVPGGIVLKETTFTIQ